jgi:hypothetical protein
LSLIGHDGLGVLRCLLLLVTRQERDKRSNFERHLLSGQLPDGHNLKATLVGIGITGLPPGEFSVISPGTKIPGQVNQFVGG